MKYLNLKNEAKLPDILFIDRKVKYFFEQRTKIILSVNGNVLKIKEFSLNKNNIVKVWLSILLVNRDQGAS